MKYLRRRNLLILFCLSTAIVFVSAKPSDFLKVSITVDVELMLPESDVQLPEKKGMVTAVGSGSFTGDFVFESNLSEEELTSQGDFYLQHYESLSFGTAKDCVVSLPEKAYEARHIKWQCSIRQSKNKLENGKQAKELQFRIHELPVNQMLLVNWNCGGVTSQMPDPAILTQLYLPLYAESWNFVVPVNDTYITTRKNYPLHLGTKADLTFSITIREMADGQ